MRWAGRDRAWLGNWGVSRTIDCNLKFFPGHSIQSLATETTSAPKLESKEQREKVPRLPYIPLPLLHSTSLLPLGSKSWPWLKLFAAACDVREGNAMWVKLRRLLLRLRFVPCQRCRSTQTYMVYSHRHTDVYMYVCLFMCFYVFFMYICCVPCCCSLLAQFIIYYFHCHENLFSFFR